LHSPDGISRIIRSWRGRKEEGRMESENAWDMEREGLSDGEARNGGIGVDFSVQRMQLDSVKLTQWVLKNYPQQ